MPKPTKGPRLASGPTHQKHLIRGLVASLIVEDRIRTSEAKARLVRPYADKLVTLGKTDTLHARRQALRWIEDDDVVHKLFAEVAPRFHDRNGGYTRILKLGPRKGDAAPMAILEFVEEVTTSGGKAKEKETEAARKRRLGRRKAEAPAEDAPKPRSRTRKAKEEAPEDESPVEVDEPAAESTPVDEAAVETAGDDKETE
jgi:large subunit ribosomal protein L17